jgi:hypothetical protein
MAKYQFSVSGSQLTVSLVPVSNDVQPTSMTYLAPSFKIGVEKINVYEYGEPKQSFGFTEIGEINGVEPTDLQDAFDKLTSVTANFNGGGASTYKLISTASTNANVVKSSKGNLSSIIAIGLTSDVRFLKLYNKATSPTVGTDVPALTIPIPANTQGAGIAISLKDSVEFDLGISIAITSGSADNDTGAIGAGDVIVNLIYV